jgi:purine-cytosine permease-like protein
MGAYAAGDYCRHAKSPPAAALSISAGIGTALGAAGILFRLTDFLGLLSSLVPPLNGIITTAAVYVILEKLFPINTGR